MKRALESNRTKQETGDRHGHRGYYQGGSYQHDPCQGYNQPRSAKDTTSPSPTTK